ncbi:MAG: hypothetical protein ACI9C4_000181 [Paraglaciecola sp.]|jgi:hypothetical protein
MSLGYFVSLMLIKIHYYLAKRNYLLALNLFSFKWLYYILKKRYFYANLMLLIPCTILSVHKLCHAEK